MKSSYFIKRIESELEASCRVKQSFSSTLKAQIALLAEIVASSLESGGIVYWMGNGGSAADAQHLAAELVGKLGRRRPALSSIALTTNTSLLTAVANDFSFDEIFSRQVGTLVRQGDVLIGLSTSGNSENIIRALKVGEQKKACTVGWTGKTGGRLKNVAKLSLCIPSLNTQLIQEAHITIGHIVCGLVEDHLEKQSSVNRGRKLKGLRTKKPLKGN